MLARLANSLRQRQDLILVVLMMMTIVLMILPMPTLLLDVLIGVNISLTILILTVAIYLRRPDQFSTFPAVILIGTAFRLAISISTTRLILTQADAGEVIETFGTFVTAGNVVIGLVIFLIITTVQFLVITKGSERVAEVAARFVLDALPGRQMSIDAELRAGDITPGEAKQRRRQLDRENQFYGAMDGAMKFVKGDAIAGLIIIAVNLLGGVAVGMVQHGLPLSDAINIYSRLTIGDGLVAQIPALFMALCAGTVITRVTTDDQSDLGTDIFHQLVSSPRSLWISAIVVGLLAMVPGFPKPVFFGLAAGLGLMAYTLTRRAAAARAQEQGANQGQAQSPNQGQERGLNQEERGERLPERPESQSALAASGDLAGIRLGSGLMDEIDQAFFIAEREEAANQYRAELGIAPPNIGLVPDERLDARGFEIEIEGVPVFSGAIPLNSILLETEQDMAELAGIATTPVAPEWPMAFAKWAPAQSFGKAQAAGIAARRPEQVLIMLALRYIRENIGHVIGFRDMQILINEINATSPEIVEQISQNVTPARTLDILRRLLEEGVSLSARRILFETIVELAGQESDTALLVEQIRRAMRRQICNGVADRNRVIAAYVVEPDLEQLLRSSLRQTEAGVYLMLSSSASAALLGQFEKIRPTTQPGLPAPVIVTATDLRRHLRGYLVEHGLPYKVLSFQEISQEFYLQPVGTLSENDTAFETRVN